MPIAEGSTTYYSYKKEAVENVEEVGAGGKILRRVTGRLDLKKPEVTSAEKRDDFQELEVNHGTRSVDWSIAGEMFGGDYAEFWAAQMRRDFSAVVPVVSSGVGDDFTIAGGVLTRGAGGSESFLDDGLMQGQIIRLASMTGADNLARNLRITAPVTATTIALAHVDGGLPVADDAGPNLSAQILVPGKETFIPPSAHTRDTFTIERHDRASVASDIGWGCKVGSTDLSVQPDQPIGLTFTGMGIDRRSADTSMPSLATPGAAGVGPALSAAIGYARVNGVVVAVITGLTLNANNGINNRPVAFDNVSPDVFFGRTAQITGTINVLKQGIAISQIFDGETEISMEFFMEAPGIAPKAFFSIFMARVKLSTDSEDDPDGPVVQTYNFRALKPRSGTGLHLTSIHIQDSSAA